MGSPVAQLGSVDSELLQRAGPVFHMPGAANLAIFQLLDVDGHDVETAAPTIHTEEGAGRM